LRVYQFGTNDPGATGNNYELQLSN